MAAGRGIARPPFCQAALNYDVGLASAATVIRVAALPTLSLTSFHMLERVIHYES